MNANVLIVALSAVAANNKEGYTVDAVTLQPITKGYAVALAAVNSYLSANAGKYRGVRGPIYERWKLLEDYENACKQAK